MSTEYQACSGVNGDCNVSSGVAAAHSITFVLNISRGCRACFFSSLRSFFFLFWSSLIIDRKISIISY